MAKSSHQSARRIFMSELQSRHTVTDVSVLLLGNDYQYQSVPLHKKFQALLEQNLYLSSGRITYLQWIIWFHLETFGDW